MLHVTHKWSRVPADALTVDTTAKSGVWSELSPFLLPGGPLYGEESAVNMENAWQFAKVYPQHADDTGAPGAEYWRWARAGWADVRAHRYPMGKGARPLYSLWEAGARLSYLEARRRIYAPLYARAVVVTEAYARLEEMLKREERDLYLRDWDGYDHLALGLTIDQVAGNPARKMGHAFVLWALLTGHYAALVREPPSQPGSQHLLFPAPKA